MKEINPYSRVDLRFNYISKSRHFLEEDLRRRSTDKDIEIEFTDEEDNQDTTFEFTHTFSTNNKIASKFSNHLPEINTINDFNLAIQPKSVNEYIREEDSDKDQTFSLRDDLYIHERSCACFACTYQKDSALSSDREAIRNLTNSDENFTPTIPFGKLSTLANYLTTGYWEAAGTYTRKFNLGSTGTGAKNGALTYNITGWIDDSNGLSQERKDLTREVFKLYEGITGINFVEVSTDGDIRFTDNDSGAYAYLGGGWYDQNPDSGATNTNAVIADFSVINIASNWYSGDSSYNGYTPQTIFHEIGHALGLGHQGQYDAGEDSPTYTNSAEFGNDNWSVTMMSYWDQVDNTNMDGSFAFLQTPMSVDWLAINEIYESYGYGTSNAFTGNTIYGVGTNISIETSKIFNNFAQMIGQTSYTLIDSGGVDVLNVSNFSNNQYINLTPSNPNDEIPSSSSIGGLINNLMIASDTIIEQAVGGNGDDTFTGNIADNVFVGGGGNDVFYDSIGADTYYGGSGDIDSLFFDLNYSDFTILSLDSSLTFSHSISGKTYTDQAWNDIELFYFKDDIVKTYAELLSEISTPNYQPVASDISINAAEDGNSVTASFSQSDSDSSDTHTFSITSPPVEGSVTNNEDGTFTFNPGSNFQDLADGETRQVTFQYTATDNSSSSNSTSAPATVTVIVTGSNDQPVASDISINAAEDGNSVTASFSQSDSDSSDTHTFSITSPPVEGSVTNNEDGTFTFNPGSNFQDLADGETRQVTFQYTATDNSSSSNSTSAPATVTVIVTGKADELPAPKEVIIFEEDFESAESWNNNWVQDSQSDWLRRENARTFDGSFSAELDGRANNAQLQLLNPLDISSFDDVLVNMKWLIETSFDRNEFLAFDISINKDSWQQIDILTGANGTGGDEQSGNPFQDNVIALSDYGVDFSNASTLDVRFRGTASKSNEDAYIDSLMITGLNQNGEGPTPAPVPPTLTVAADEISQNEGDQDSTPFTFTITREGDLTSDSSVQWTLVNGTTDNNDFVSGSLPSGNLTFANGSSSQTISIDVAGDTLFENDENFSIQLLSADNATIKNSSASASIINDDQEVNPTPPSEQIIFTEDFESIDSWNNNWVQDSQSDWLRRENARMFDGSFSAELDGRANNAQLQLLNPLDISSFDDVLVNMKWLIETSFDRNEFLAFDISINKDSWQQIDILTGANGTGGDEQSGNPFQDNVIALSDYGVDFSNASTLDVRFRGTANRSNEDAYIDSLVITGLNGGKESIFSLANQLGPLGSPVDLGSLIDPLS